MWMNLQSTYELEAAEDTLEDQIGGKSCAIGCLDALGRRHATPVPTASVYNKYE